MFTVPSVVRTREQAQQRRLDLIACGLPERFLPHWTDRINLPPEPPTERPT